MFVSFFISNYKNILLYISKKKNMEKMKNAFENKNLNLPLHYNVHSLFDVNKQIF